MPDTVFTRALTSAVADQGSSQALASLLRVPENTLLRWMGGAAMMPFAAFGKLLDLLTAHEQKFPPDGTATPYGVPLAFSVGELSARCTHCTSAEFLLGTAELGYSTKLICASCCKEVVHAQLLITLADQYTRQMRSSRLRRAARLPTASGKQMAARAEADRPART